MTEVLERQPDRPGIQGYAADYIEPNWTRRFMHVLDVGWARWRKTYWEMSSDAKAEALDSIDRYCQQQAEYSSESREAADARAWKSMRTAGHRRGILDLLSTRPTIRATQEQLDSDGKLLACANCVIDLESGTPRPAKPTDRITKHSPARYDPLVELDDGARLTWQTALSALPEDAREWFQLQIGLSFVGQRPKHTFVLVGKGNNGKSSLMTAIANVAGSYGEFLSNDVLMKSAARGPAPELMTLRGLRFGLIEETPEEGRLNTKRLKDLTDTAKLRTRALYKNEISFPVTHTLFINTNYLPVVDEVDDGTWRRLYAIPFMTKFVARNEVTQPDHKVGNPRIGELLALPEVQDVILDWIVQGAVKALRLVEEPAVPASVRDKTSSWRAGSDVALGFARDCLTEDSNHIVPATEMTQALNAFLRKHGKAAWSSTLLSKRLPDALVQAGLPATENKVHTIRHDEQLSMWDGPAPARTQVQGWRGLRLTVRKPDGLTPVAPSWQPPFEYEA